VQDSWDDARSSYFEGRRNEFGVIGSDIPEFETQNSKLWYKKSRLGIPKAAFKYL
jgi:hypothetical protein